jgi:GTP pyrophosphokinase
MAHDEKIKELLYKIKEYNPNANTKLVEKSLRFIDKTYHGKKTLSGDDQFLHAYNVGFILADIKLDSHTIAAGLLHGVLDHGVKIETIQHEFDAETVELVQAAARLQFIDKKTSFEEQEAENIRKIILASAKDVRVILIKLAARLHSMRTLKYLPEERRKVISQETMDIYAPIAHKLGLYSMKGELEDLAFRFLNPSIYQDLKKQIASKRDEREREVTRIVDFVNNELKKNNIEAHIEGRAKHFYSIYKKIITKRKNFERIYDLIAIRILTNSISDCYVVLGIIHKLWTPIPERFDDYIAVPKPNGYQSLHTDVITENGRILEVQIRDREMHRNAEEGIASHWRYKGDERDKRFDRQIEWLKQFLEWKRTADAKEFIESLKVDLFQQEIVVFTPKGDPIVLPEHATPIDFAYAIHSNIGDHCKLAKVNGMTVPLDSTLAPGDIVEIVTVKNLTVSRAWLSFVKSIHAKVKIRHALKMPAEHRVGRKKEEEHVPIIAEKRIAYAGKTYEVKIPKCCNPTASDHLRFFKTKDGKIVMHKSDCVNIHAYDAKKEVMLHVAEEEKSILLHVEVHDRVGVLSEILSAIAKEKYNVKSLNTKFGKEGRVILYIELALTKKIDVKQIISHIKKIDSVYAAYIDED